MLKLSCSIMKLNSLSLSFKVLPTWYMLVQIPMRFHFSKNIPFFSCANMIKNPFTNYSLFNVSLETELFHHARTKRFSQTETFLFVFPNQTQACQRIAPFYSASK